MSLDSKENKSSHTEMNGQSDIDSKLDQLLKDLNEVSSNVDRVNKVARTILMQ